MDAFSSLIKYCKGTIWFFFFFFTKYYNKGRTVSVLLMRHDRANRHQAEMVVNFLYCLELANEGKKSDCILCFLCTFSTPFDQGYLILPCKLMKENFIIC